MEAPRESDPWKNPFHNIIALITSKGRDSPCSPRGRRNESEVLHPLPSHHLLVIGFLSFPEADLLLQKDEIIIVNV